jgi:hypothetical protein
VVGTTHGTISLPSAHSIDVKSRFKFGYKVVRIQIVFERRNRGTFQRKTTGRLTPVDQFYMSTGNSSKKKSLLGKDNIFSKFT